MDVPEPLILLGDGSGRSLTLSVPSRADSGGLLEVTEALTAQLMSGRTGRSKELPFDLARAELTLFLAPVPPDPGTGRRRRPVLRRRRPVLSAAEVWARRPEERARAARALGLDHLDDAQHLSDALNALDDPVLRGIVRHAVPERHRVEAAAGLLRAEQLAELGSVLTASHLSLRDQDGTSRPAADRLVNAAIVAGARGARAVAPDVVAVLAPSAKADALRATLIENAISK